MSEEFDHAQSPRLGQPLSPENPGIRMFSGTEIPEVAYRGQMIYRTDNQNIQVYNGVAWEEVVGGDFGQLTFVGPEEPVASQIGDIWYDTDDNYRLYVWDGAIWQSEALGIPAERLLGDTSITSNLTISGSLIARGPMGEQVGISGDDGFFVRAAPQSGETEGPTWVQFPTDGTKPNIISGQLNATRAAIEEGLTLRGTSGLEPGAVFVLTGKISPPKNLPVLSYNYTTITLANPSLVASGLCQPSSGNYYTMTAENVVSEFSSSTGAFVTNRTVSGSLELGVLCKLDGSAFYTFKRALVGFTTQITIYTYNAAWSLTGTSSFTISSGAYSVKMGNDYTTGGFLCLYTLNSSAGWWVAPVTVTGTVTNSYMLGSSSFTVNTKNTVGYIGKGTFDFGTTRVLAANKNYTEGRYTSPLFLDINAFSTSNPYSLQTSDSWPKSSAADFNGMTWDGTRFTAILNNKTLIRFESSAVSAGQVNDSVWTSTTGGNRWVAYSWYEDVNIAHETDLSPRSFFQLPKRSRMYVTVDPIPNGLGEDTPTKARIYVATQTADPGASGAAWKLRATITYPSVSTGIPATYSTSAASPPAINTFGATSSPGGIVSADGGSYWYGDNSAKFYQMVVDSVTDAAATAGNKPALRIGDITAKHLRIDNNEILAMLDDTSQGTLLVNAGGPVSASGWIKNGTASCAVGALNTVYTKSVTFNSAFPDLGAVPTVVVTPTLTNVGGVWTAVKSISRSGFDIQYIRSDNTTTFDVQWIAIA